MQGWKLFFFLFFRLGLLEWLWYAEATRTSSKSFVLRVCSSKWDFFLSPFFFLTTVRTMLVLFLFLVLRLFSYEKR